MTSAVVDGNYMYEFDRVEEFTHREMMDFLATIVALKSVRYVESPRLQDTNGGYCIGSLRVRLDGPIGEHELRAELDQAVDRHIGIPAQAVA